MDAEPDDDDYRCRYMERHHQRCKYLTLVQLLFSLRSIGIFSFIKFPCAALGEVCAHYSGFTVAFVTDR